MAKFDYNNAQKTAKNLLTKFGQVVDLVRANSSYDPVTGAENNLSKQTTKATVVVLPAGMSSSSFDNKFKEQLKKAKGRFFYVAAKGLAFTPEAGDYFEFEGGNWELAGSTPLNPAGTPVLFTVGAKLGNKQTIGG